MTPGDRNARQIYDKMDTGNMMTVVHVSENILRHGKACIEELQNETSGAIPPNQKKRLIAEGLDALDQIDFGTELYTGHIQSILRGTRNDVSDQAKHTRYSTDATRALLEIYADARQWNDVYNKVLENPKMRTSGFARKAVMASSSSLYSSIYNAAVTLQKGKPEVSLEEVAKAMTASQHGQGNAL